MKTPKEKAAELVEMFKDFVHGYVGGSMLSCYEYPDQILAQAKKCAIIVTDEILSVWGINKIANIYWNEVKSEIQKIK